MEGWAIGKDHGKINKTAQSADKSSQQVSVLQKNHR
jgi:hypothetical protein